MLHRTGFLAATAAAALAPLRATAQTATIRFAVPLNDTAAQPFYAQDLGWFKRAGLNIDLSSMSSGTAVAQAVAGGALDIGLTNVIGLAGAIAKGIPLALIAPAGLYSTSAPTTALAVAKTSALRVPRDLENRTIAIPALRDMTYAATAAWLEKAGADVSKVRFVEIPFPEAEAALERGTVDAAMIAEPALSSALRGSARLFGKAFDAIAPQFMVTAFFGNAAWMKQNPELVRKVATVLYDTARWANGNHAASGDMLAARTKMDPAVVRTMTRATYAVSNNAALIQPALNAGYKYKLLDVPMTPADMMLKA